MNANDSGLCFHKRGWLYRSTHIIWLVVWTPPKNIKVNWDDYSQYGKIKHVPNHQLVLDDLPFRNSSVLQRGVTSRSFKPRGPNQASVLRDTSAAAPSATWGVSCRNVKPIIRHFYPCLIFSLILVWFTWILSISPYFCFVWFVWFLSISIHFYPFLPSFRGVAHNYTCF